MLICSAGEVKSLLLDFTIGANSKNATIRKIKPLTTTTKAAESISHKQIQVWIFLVCVLIVVSLLFKLL